MKKQIELEYAFGYVYDKSKLVALYPVGSNIMDLEEYEMEVEVAFLEDSIDKAFQEEDIIQANEIMKPLETYLMKPSKILPLIVDIKDVDTKDSLTKLLNEFEEEYDVKESYVKRGYEFVDMYEVFQNISKYIPNENLETLNILKIEKDKFDMEKFIDDITKNLDEAINKDLVETNMKKSDLTPRLFVKSEEVTNTKYIVFATDISTYSRGALCANREEIEDLDVDMGDIEISTTKDVGYMVEENNNVLTFKVANYNSMTANNSQIAQIVDYCGIFKPKMIEFINRYVK